MTVQSLTNSKELKSAISTSFDLRRRIQTIYISSMNLHDPEITKRCSFLDMIKLLSSKCTINILIGECPHKIEDKYEDVATKIKELIEDFDVNFFYHKNIHAKQILVNDRDEKIIFIGSCNFTTNALTNLYEVGLIVYVRDEDENEAYDNLLTRITNKIQTGCDRVVVDPVSNQLDWM